MDSATIGGRIDVESKHTNKIFTSSTNALTQEEPIQTPPKIKSNLRQPMEREHIEDPEVGGKMQKQIMADIQEKPITIMGEPTMITNCPHDCNNQGLCQRIFVKIKTSDSPDTFSYDPQYSCACKENFKGLHCEECSKGFFGKN
jgi:hypothetical protein